MDEKVNGTGTNGTTPDTTVPDVSSLLANEGDSKPKKALKWVVRGLVVLLTTAAGFALGRACERNNEAETETNDASDNNDDPAEESSEDVTE